MNPIRRSLSAVAALLGSEGGSLRQRTVRSSVWVGLSSLIVGMLSFVKSIVLARLLMPEHFGLMAICLTVIRTVEVFTETGIAAALIQRRHEVQEAKYTAFTIASLRGLLLAIVVFAASGAIAGFYEQPSLEILLRVLALSLLLGGLSNVDYILMQRELNFRPHFFLQQFLAIADFVVTIGLAWWLRSVWALIGGHMLRTAIGVPLSYMLLPGRLRFEWDPRLAGELLTYGKYIFGISIVVFVTTEIDNAVIGKILGMEVLGAYVLAYMLANLPATHFAKVIANVMFAAYSKLQSDRAALERAFLQTNRIVATFALPAAVGMAALADPIVTIVFGPKWELAAVVLPVLCVFGALRAITAINGYVLNAIGKPEVTFYLNLAKLIVIAVAIVPATRRYGIVGAAASVTLPSAAAYILGNVVFARFAGFSHRRIYESAIPALLASAAMGGSIVIARQWLMIDSPIALIAIVLVGAAIYASLNLAGIRGAIAVFATR